MKLRRPVLNPEFKLCQPLPRLSLELPQANLGSAAARHPLDPTTAILQAQANTRLQGDNQISAAA